MITRTVATWITALTVGTILAGCATSPGGGPGAPAASAASSAPPVAAAHNQADITFAQSMIPHHQQAVRMAELASNHAEAPRVKDLAKRVDAAQQPEIDQMSRMLTIWNASMPTPGGADHSTMNHGDMPGMMSADQLRQLEQSGGAAFDTMFLTMMIGHHEGAVAMARTELEQGTNREAKALAQRIIDAQEGEIAEMRGLLAQR